MAQPRNYRHRNVESYRRNGGGEQAGMKELIALPDQDSDGGGRVAQVGSVIARTEGGDEKIGIIACQHIGL
jgi:hypothetical protein